MSTLTEIEAAAEKLPRREQRKLRTFLTKALEKPAPPKRKGDALAALEAHRRRMRELAGGKPLLTKKGWRLLAKMIAGE